MQSRATLVAGARVLEERPVHRVQQPQALADALGQVAVIGLERHGTPDVDRREVHRRVPIGDPVGQHPASPAGGLDADGVEARSDEAAVDLRCLAEVIGAIWCERLGTVEEQLHAAIGQRRHPVTRPLEHRTDVVPVFVERAKAEVPRDAVEAPHLGLGLEEADHELAGLFLEVRVVSGVAKYGRGGVEPLKRFGDHVEVLAGLQRDVHPDLRSQVAGPHAGCEHNGLGFDQMTPVIVGAASGFRPRTADGTVAGFEAGDRHPFDDAAPAGSCPLGQSHGGVHRRDQTVVWQVQRAHEIVGADQRPHLGELVHVDLAGLDADSGPHRRAAQDLLPTLGIRRDRDRARRPEAGGLARLVLQRFEQAHRVRGELGEAVRRLELRRQPGCMPGGAGGELVLLEQQHVADAATHEVVGDGTADDASADNDHCGSVGDRAVRRCALRQGLIRHEVCLRLSQAVRGSGPRSSERRSDASCGSCPRRSS